MFTYHKERLKNKIMLAITKNIIKNQTKWSELENLNLFGFKCYMREIKEVNIYHFSKEIQRGKFINIKTTFENIEFCLEHQISL